MAESMAQRSGTQAKSLQHKYNVLEESSQVREAWFERSPH